MTHQGVDIPFCWVKNKRRRKSLGLYIKPSGEIEVRTPLRTSQKKVEMFVSQHAQWIAEKQARRVDIHPQITAHHVLKSDAEMLYDDSFKRMLPHANEMGIQHNGAFKMRKMRRRWGSCRVDGCITLNTALASLPTHLVDYVVLHELCHVREMNHSRAFYALLKQAMPDYRTREKELKQYQISV